MSSLSPEQRQLVASWAADGASLNQIQDRMRTECGLTLTYMEARLLIMDLGLKIQDKPREKPPEEPKAAPPPQPPADGAFEDQEFESTAAADGAAAPAGTLSVSVDEFPLQGAAISGKATFSDGNTVVWFMDQMGRFGMRGPAPGYQPPAADIPAFQQELDTLLSVRGF